ncbi:MAG: ABC transporter substrate-binding protein [Rhodospirillales bacterium]|nr:ABC transporter substrate-binding protein [Rhodospirillales bacterium]
MPKISLACWDYDRALPVLDGRIPVEGFDITAEAHPPGKLFPLAVDEAPYDVTEFSFASYAIQTARGECKYTGIPVYLSRAFRHGAIYVRADSGIETARDLEGRVVGVPEYAMTLAVWVRGILADDFGVDVSKLRYRTAGLNEPGRVERLKLDLPPEIDLQPLGPDKSLNDAMLAGDLEGIIAPAPPRAFADGNPIVKRLIEPVAPAERDYFSRTGIFPIMHILALRKDVAAANPALPKALYDAFEAGRVHAMKRVKSVAEGSANRDMSPWYADAYESAVRCMGADFWTYGVKGNETALNAFCRYIHDQYLSDRLVALEELFHPDCL